MSRKPQSKLEEATRELEKEIRKARSFHQGMKTSSPKSAPHRHPKLSLSTPPLPSLPPRSPGRSFLDNLPLPPRSRTSSYSSGTSKSPPRSTSTANQEGRRGSDPVAEGEQVEQGETAAVREKKSFSSRRERPSELQSFEMQDRSGTSSLSTTPIKLASHNPFMSDYTTASSSPSRSPHKSSSAVARANLDDALLSTLPRTSPIKSKGKTKEIDPLCSDDSQSSEDDEFSFLSNKKPAPRKPSQTNDFLAFLASGPPSLPPVASPPARRALLPSTATSKPIFSFLSLRRSSVGKAPKAALASRAMESATTVPTRGKKAAVAVGGTTPSLPVVEPSVKTDWLPLQKVGSLSGGSDDASRKRSKEEERQSVEQWKEWASGLATLDAADRTGGLELRRASESIPSSSALISEGIISSSQSPAQQLPLLLSSSPYPHSSIPIPQPRRRNSSLTTAGTGTQNSRFSTSTTTTSHPLSVTKSSIYSTYHSTAPSSPLFPPSTSSLSMHHGPPPLPLGTALSPFAPIRSRFQSEMPKTLLLELLSTLTLFGETYTAILRLPSNSNEIGPLRKEEAFYKSEISAVVGEITELLGPSWDRILHLGCPGGYGPLSRPGEGWGLGRGERFEDRNWWRDRLQKDLEEGLLSGCSESALMGSSGLGTISGNSQATMRELEGDDDAWKDQQGEVADIEGDRLRSDLKEEGRRRYEAWKAGLGVQGVRSAT